MSRTALGEVRRNQLITTYGVGAIVAVEDEAFMVAGIDRWPVQGPNMHEPRLERDLNVDGFAIPPATDKGRDIPVVRFPTMYSCPECRRLDRHGFFTSFASNKCGSCNVPLVPSRFVMACGRGHIDDFPYFRWAHAGSRPSGEERKHLLHLTTSAATASLADIEISCSCGKRATMDGSFGKTALRNVSPCTGRRPWLTGDNEACDDLPRTLQRGASSVWFPVVASALSIPPWSEGAFRVLNAHWQILRHIDDQGVRQAIIGLKLSERSGFSVEELVDAVRLRRQGESTSADEPLRPQEFAALVRGRKDDGSRQDFVCEDTEVDAPLQDFVDKVMLVTRLREVRVLTSFTRILPPAHTDPSERRAALFNAHPRWLPGIEVTGEGVFIRLSREHVEAWEGRKAVRARASRIDANYRARARQAGTVPDRTISARLVGLHTIAHALIGQWSLDSGYPAASLRERLYVDDQMLGVLIYTATSDSAGSLGGVIAQARPGRLAASVGEAVARASWCSADPLCVEADAVGVDSLNLAACHACILLPEVSCEESNILLDRALLVGTPDDSSVGLLSNMLSE